MTRQRPPRSSTSRRTPAQRAGKSSGKPLGKPVGKLRIIGGEFRRRQLPVLDSPGLRPTPDRVRETLFNWLGQQLYGQQVLDLFAGSGALGIEAFSRGAAWVDFIERDPRVAAQLSTNLATLNITASAVHVNDVQSYLTRPAKPYALVFLDPPFHQQLAAPCCAALEIGGWLSEEAMIYLETETSLAPNVPANWLLHRETKAGESTARLYLRQVP
ncbi:MULTISPECIES: 16S rRNA (guanine(966)-N(2))-methyltransferase RsmD [unclassified Halomonas]|uniref:16S rRNA (guanine(966)-N(2))-methyltransferase RsmD n=1 Tax=unclassified Halomonas TaxID=2609666 RepID=UPI0007D8E2E9|nr:MULTISPECIES: 16S rRNA (guanine(966)-N(2))-methyltransferase RsmD [unclassified Halomonas]MBT2786949.1 16S rRNA (guanine(966)-N(2))-methyltransferase RsmD [Halomonas sp. ISL-106]MBT2798398.1 16S rRNA (guanine(966)-N(2))-methyltransferase RsmD [Halomonas sp. ISL-104]OAL58222.1 16S rRNA (guanine(966)-N(2))-methyltransferase RsmD [Halomonas sp. ALS9]